MNTTELLPDIPRFDNDPRDWNWEAEIKECLSNEAYCEPGSDPIHALFIGSVFSVMPSGKYWTYFASGNVTQEEQQRDIDFNEVLEACADEAGGWIENGLNGDYCDMFFCMAYESNDLDESMDGDHESALASAGFGTDEDYGGCDERC